MPLGETDFTEGVGIGEEETEKGAHFIIALKISLATPGEFLAHPLATTCHSASQPTPPPSYPFLCSPLSYSSITAHKFFFILMQSRITTCSVSSASIYQAWVNDLPGYFT